MSYGNNYPPQGGYPQQGYDPNQQLQQQQPQGGYQQQPQQGYQQHPPQQQGPARIVVDGWSAMQNGIEPGKAIEYEVVQQQNAQGGKYYIFSLYKLYKSKKPEDANNPWKKSFGFIFGNSFNNMANEIVDRLNHALIRWGNPKGQYVFQPVMQAIQQPLPMGQPQQPMQQPPQQQAQQVPYNPGPGGYPNNG